MAEPQEPDRIPVTDDQEKQAAQEFKEGPDRRNRFYGRRAADRNKEIDRRYIVAALVVLGIGVFSSQFYITRQSHKVEANQENIANIVVATNLWGCAIVTAKTPEERLKALNSYGAIRARSLPAICQSVALRSQVLAERALNGKDISGRVK